MTYRRKDAHYRRARAAGYRARSAYKLIELDRRYGLLHPGDFVVDLGAWPGAWLQVVGERIGEHGRAVGVDTAPISPLGAPNLGVLAGDVRDPATIEAIRTRLGRPADVVLSDLSPKLTGVRATDEARGVELVRAAVLALSHLLRPGGRFVTKVFMTDDYDAWVADLRRHFTRLDATRPEATRRGSAELYVVGLGYRPASA